MPFPLFLLQAEAALFSLELKVGGVPVPMFGEVTVTRTVSGLGTSGLCTSELKFTCPAPLNAYRAATAELTGNTPSGILDLPMYYIDSRQTSGGIVSVTALDRMAFTDEPFDADRVDHDDDGNALTSAVLSVIAEKCGFSGYGLVIPPWLTYFPKSYLDGRSCADILETISTAVCGYWYVSSDNTLAFREYGTSSGNVEITSHAALSLGDEYTPKGVRVTDGENVYERGSTLYSYDALQVSTDFAVDDTAADIWGRAEGIAYDAVSCSECILPFIPFPSCDVTFAQDPSRSYRIMSVTADISLSGIKGNLSTSAPSGGEISRRGRLQRAVDGKVTLGKRYGSAVVSSDGVIWDDSHIPETDYINEG